MVVVIPCCNEAGLLGALEALARCERPDGAVEVVVVVNSGEGAAAEVLARNEQTVAEARAWMEERQETRFRWHVLDCAGLPKKKAGVGLARKIGMDEGLRRLAEAGRPEGVIACFDADCSCDGNYLRAIEAHFAGHPESPGCSIYFEHPLEGAEEEWVCEAITRYELHLRAYVEGLRAAGFPHAFHTVGSSMAARAEAYCRQGGMNTRQAGEDFYFLHKIIPLGGFGEVNATRVVPSPRVSDRVPFGTGRAVGEYGKTGRMETYPAQVYRDLRGLFQLVESLRRGAADLGELNLAAPLREFLELREWRGALEEIRRNTRSEEAFVKRFFGWFDGFMAMKYAHHARDRHYGAVEAGAGAREIWGLAGGESADGWSERELLQQFRAKQRRGKQAY